MRRHSNKLTIRDLLTAVTILLVSVLSSSAQSPHGAPNPVSVGRIDAPFLVEVFYDFQCPSCAAFHPILNKIEERHGEQVRIVIRHLPLTIHDKAYDAAMAVEAAGMQGKFWEMSDLLLTNQSRWANSKDFQKRFTRYAKIIGLDVQRFGQDRVGIATRGRVDLDIQRAKSLEIKSVPSVILNGKLLTYTEALELEEIISKGN